MFKKTISLIIITSFFWSCATKPTATTDPEFEKIIFHTSACFGDCPIYHLEVKNDKKVKLITEKSFRNSKLKLNEPENRIPNYRIGTVNDTMFNQLAAELNTIGLESLEFDGATCCDRPLITIIVYYNGKRKLLQSMFPPDKANRLIEILYEVSKSNDYQKSNDAFSLEAVNK
jgi:hypothetical protein